MAMNRTAVVTGGGQGIGRAVALALGARGDAVVVCGRTEETLQSVVDEIHQSGGRALALVADMRSAESVEALFAEVFSRYDAVGVLVTCAVKSRVAGFMELSDEDWLGHYETKVLGAVRCIRQVVPGMSRQGWGRIVNLGGTSARSVADGRITNGMTNAAITNIGRHLAQEFAGQGILVNTVHPGYTQTPRLTMIVDRMATDAAVSFDEAQQSLEASIGTGRFIQPCEIADLILFLCSDSNRSITGQALAVDGGLGRAITY